MNIEPETPSTAATDINPNDPPLSAGLSIINSINFCRLYTQFRDNHGDITYRWMNNMKLTEDQTALLAKYVRAVADIYIQSTAEKAEINRMSIDDIVSTLLASNVDPF